MSAEWVAALAALLSAAALILGWAMRWAWKIMRRVNHFLDDYAGEPARDGLPARPGLMARLTAVEASLAHVVTETSPNHGNSLRDIVLKTAADVADIKDEQAQVRTRLELFDARRAGHEEGKR